MTRRAFRMRLKPGGLDEYRRHHDEIWPELVSAIEASGIARITIYEDDPELVLVSEVADDGAWQRLWTTEVHERWGRMLQPYMEIDAGGAPVSSELREIFDLETRARS